MPSEYSTFEQAVEALYNLNVGVIGTGADRHERPHKPGLAEPAGIPQTGGCKTGSLYG